MSDYPMLFSMEMVRAILHRKKTQTRRVIKHQPEFGAYISLDIGDRICLVHEDWAGNGVGLQAFPYARKIGDRLWVREKCAIGFNDDGDLVVDYHADGKRRWFEVTPENQRYADRYINDDWRRPSIHMPRWASRITLEVVSVRAERLQEISEQDAHEEGVECDIWDQALVTKNHLAQDEWFQAWSMDEPGYVTEDRIWRASFESLWDSINGNRNSWSLDPWVWVIEFKVVEVKS